MDLHIRIRFDGPNAQMSANCQPGRSHQQSRVLLPFWPGIVLSPPPAAGSFRLDPLTIASLSRGNKPLLGS